MSYAIDPSLDYLMAEEPIQITYFYQTSEGVFNPQVGARVSWVEAFSVDRSTALTDPDLWKRGRIFMIYSVPWKQAGLKDPPKMKDRIIDNKGVAWRVEQVGILSLSTRYRLVCHQEVQ